MAKSSNDEMWREFIEKYSSYGGSAKSFCKENNISKNQFNYYKKKLMKYNKLDESIFYAVVVNEKDYSFETTKINEKEHKEIKLNYTNWFMTPGVIPENE